MICPGFCCKKIGEDEIDNPYLGTINCFTYESEKVIDIFSTASPNIRVKAGATTSGHGGSRRQNGGVVRYIKRGTTSAFSGGHLDSIGLGKVAFTAEAYSSSDVKHYFNCHAWVPKPYSYDADETSTRQLYQLWISEGFIPDNSEATAEKYLEPLMNRVFVDAKKRSDGGRINACPIRSR
ncbi:hypothetical protein WN943_001592 [Citrus x changshan-huyou]